MVKFTSLFLAHSQNIKVLKDYFYRFHNLIGFIIKNT